MRTFGKMGRWLAVAAMLLAGGTARAEEITMFAAASLADAMKDIAALWVKAGHAPVKLSFGSSSTLARQIEQGAPANLFASADEQWADYLTQRKLLADDTRRSLLGNTLVLVVPASQARTVVIDGSLDVNALLGANGRIATGDPKHVPVGIYTEQALKRLGLWERLGGRIAATENVRAALLLVERGEAPAGVVYSTDAAVSKSVAVAGVFPATSHDPVSYPFAVTKAGDTPEARAFLAFLAGAEARGVFAKFGFKLLN